MDTREEINALEHRQHELKATIQKSDEHALKCAKSGLNFKKTYPDDWAAYESARMKYNENETALAELYAQLEAEHQSEAAVQTSAMTMNQEG